MGHSIVSSFSNLNAGTNSRARALALHQYVTCPARAGCSANLSRGSRLPMILRDSTVKRSEREDQTDTEQSAIRASTTVRIRPIRHRKICSQDCQSIFYSSSARRT
eukprot:746214-Hanusia_phi.AAC.2